MGILPQHYVMIRHMIHTALIQLGTMIASTCSKVSAVRTEVHLCRGRSDLPRILEVDSGGVSPGIAVRPATIAMSVPSPKGYPMYFCFSGLRDVEGLKIEG